jgi:hypothetical protein
MAVKTAFIRDLEVWLHEQAGPGTPDYLDDVIAGVNATSQQSGSSLVLQRWVGSSQLGRTGAQSVGRLVIVVAIIAWLLAAAVIIGGPNLLVSPEPTSAAPTASPSLTMSSPSPSPSFITMPPPTDQPLPSPCATVGHNIDHEANIKACNGAYDLGELTVGRHSLTVDGVSFSFVVPGRDWEQFGNISLQNGTRHRGQAAEAIIYWTAFPDGEIADLCDSVLVPPGGPQTDRIAAAVAAAPGVDVVNGPVRVIVGGHVMDYVEVTVREDLGCDQGYFYSWPYADVGALWPFTDVGDTIRVWIVDVDGTRRLFIGGVTARDVDPVFGKEIQQIVGSIRFE